MTRIHLTSRALDDIRDIYDYSFDEWGEQTALKYIEAFEDAFSLLREHKGLLKVNEKISSRFSVYAVQRHSLSTITLYHSTFGWFEPLSCKVTPMGRLHHLI